MSQKSEKAPKAEQRGRNPHSGSPVGDNSSVAKIPIRTNLDSRMKDSKPIAILAIAAVCILAVFFIWPSKRPQTDPQSTETAGDEPSSVSPGKSSTIEPKFEPLFPETPIEYPLAEEPEAAPAPPTLKDFRDLLADDLDAATQAIYAFHEQVSLEPYLELIWRGFDEYIGAENEHDWARRLDPNEDVSAILLEQFIALRSKDGPADNKDLVRELEASVNYPMRNAAIMVAMNMYEENPEDAMVWTGSLSKQENREAALIALLGLWSNRDPEDAITFLDTARDSLGLDNDVLSATYAKAAIIPNPVYAITIAEEIRDPQKRNETLKEVLTKWHNTLPGEARAWTQVNRERYPEFKDLFEAKEE